MVISKKTILGWGGITNNANKNTIVTELISPPEGIAGLKDETEEGMIATFCDFARQHKNDVNIIFSRVQNNCITYLMDRVKKKIRLDKPTDFKAGTYKAEFIAQLEEASQRKKCRSNQNNISDSLITLSFQVQQ